MEFNMIIVGEMISRVIIDQFELDFSEQAT